MISLKTKDASSLSPADAEATDTTGNESLKSLSCLTQRNVEIVAELERAGDAQRSPTDRLADVISRFVGSMTFVYIHVVWFGAWIVLNTFPILPANWRIDPFPFTFLTFVVSLEAIFLSTFILISQNHEERLAQRRNHLDLQINLLSEQENSQILKMLESIERHLGIREAPAVHPMTEPTKPDELVSQIEDVIENGNG